MMSLANDGAKGKIMTMTATAIFNGTYTLTNVATGDYKTLRVRTQKADARFAAGKRIAALLSGPDNNTSYTGFAFVDDASIRVWGKKRAADGKGAFEYYANLLPKASEALIGAEGLEVDGTFTAAGREYRVQLSKKCLVCNRKLTTPESINRGMGPRCRMGIA